ncbi:MAG: hypothetical protein U0412_09750 [Nitrospira sp.]
MNAGKYGRSSAALKELLALDPLNMEARRLFATLHLRLGSLLPARQAFESLANEALERQDYWLAESLLREYLVAGPRCVPFLEKLGVVYQQKGDALAAAEEFAKAIDILVEDPDPDRPALPAELYAKIRELAPASPPAFRLASLFDAQSGELIPRTPSSSASPVVGAGEEVVDSHESPTLYPTPIDSQTEDASTVAVAPSVTSVSSRQSTGKGASVVVAPPVSEQAAIGDPIHANNGENPPLSIIEDVPVSTLPEHSTPAVETVDQVAPSGAPGKASQPVEWSIPAAPITDPQPAGESVPGPMPWEQVEEHSVQIPQPEVVSDFTTPEPAPVSAQIEPQASPVEIPSSVQPDAEASVLSATGSNLSMGAAQDYSPEITWTIPDGTPQEPTPSIEPSSASTESTIATIREISSESAHGLMPWDQVQESTVTIPGSERSLEANASTMGESTQTASDGVAYEQPTHHLKSDQVTDVSEVEREGFQDQPVVHPSETTVAQEAVTASPQNPTNPAGGQFSWTSIFNEAWKFGSASSAPHESFQHPVANHPEALPESVPFGVVPESAPVQNESAAAAPATEPTVSPMPWEQIEESSIVIPPPEDPVVAPIVEEVVTAVNAAPVIEESIESLLVRDAELGMPVQPELASSIAMSSVESTPVGEPPAVGEDTPFRLQDSASSTDGQTRKETAAIGRAEAVPSLELSHATSVTIPVVESERESFRLAPSPTPSPAVVPPVQSVPVSEPVPQPRVEKPADTIELVPPTLTRELLPVLQTLVDQLSGAAKPTTAPPNPVPEASPVTAEAPPIAAESIDGGTHPSSVIDPASMPMSVTESAQASHWKTGEVAARPHRPQPKKRKKTVEPEPSPSPVIPPADEPLARVIEATGVVPSVAAESAPAQSQTQHQDDWVKTGESIRFVDPPVGRTTKDTPPSLSHLEPIPGLAPSPAASAVEVLFQSSSQHTRAQTIERPVPPKSRPRLGVKLARIRIALTLFISSCFSTTRAIVTSIVGLVVLCGALIALAVGAVGLTWLVIEEKPSAAFQSLTTTPQRTMMDSHKNGYLMLLGFEATAGADPLQAGYERKADAKDREWAAACLGGNERSSHKNASASVVQGWFSSTDPATQFKAQADSMKGWVGQAETALSRYRQWVKMPFEDWGYGQSVAPPCAAVLSAHRLYVADGFSQGMEAGVDRLDGDLEAWRTTLGQAKTLPVKTMALQAINDDVAVASGLLVRTDFDGKLLPRLSKMLRPLDQVEASMRWPMQSELVLATKLFAAQVEADRGEDVPLYVSVAGVLPLPRQRRFNDYAEYYEASYKTAGEGRYGAMPKRSTYIKQPANGVMDYLTNPIENLLGLEPLPEWERMNGLVIDTDAHLRLASLQAWLRQGPQDADLLARIAKAGQKFYDPYTGLPMLVNLRQGVMYSVGHDGKDQDADPQQDVVVSIPRNSTSSAKPASKAK